MRNKERIPLRPKFVNHFPSLSGSYSNSAYVSMFRQDISLAVMPIGGKSENDNFAVTIEGTASDCERAKQLLGEIKSHYTNEIEGLVCSAVEEVVLCLIWDGCAVFEIFNDENNIKHVQRIPAKCLRRLFGFYIQSIPRNDRQNWQKGQVAVPANRVWNLEMPENLGGKRGFITALRRLKKFERPGPEFWLQNLILEGKISNINFRQYVRHAHIYRRSVTREWSWDVRDTSGEWATEFYSVYSLVNFIQAQATLREHVISEFNRFFFRLGLRCRIKVSGLPTVTEISSLRIKLLEGKISFGEALSQAQI